MVLHFHHGYNLTIVSSFSVSSKPDHLVGHFSEAQRHPQKDLFPFTTWGLNVGKLLVYDTHLSWLGHILTAQT